MITTVYIGSAIIVVMVIALALFIINVLTA